MKKLLWIVPLAALILAGGWVAWEFYTPYKGYPESVVLTISPGARAPGVAAELQARGVLPYRFPFLFRYWLGRRRHETIKFGEYQFDRPLNVSQIYEKLIRGEVLLHAVVIPEGSDRMEMARIFERQIGLDSAAFLASSSRAAAIHDLDPLATSLEGYLFPDTYRFPRGVAASKVVSTMLARFRKVLDERFRRELPPGPASLHNALTLASLVEKETPDAKERPLIAGVFTRRLEKGMALDCDPTVIYALRLAGDQTESANLFNGPITRSDLATPSPYNTYLHAGLPPGPICSPGAASIEAALHPASGTALYFVSNNHGGHIFADTLAQHHRNVEQYRKKPAAQQGQEPKGGPTPNKPLKPRRK
ncbi:MAG: endolytic transglycosylase MltG [Terriglobia bacterium]